MLRKCEKIETEHFKRELNIKSLWKISLYADEENKKNIYDVIAQNMNRFRRALYELLQGNYNNDLYGVEKISAKTKNITAFKFKRKKTTNYRIYCKEYKDDILPNVKKVVMILVYNKKTHKVDKKLKSVLEKIVQYDYEF